MPDKKANFIKSLLGEVNFSYNPTGSSEDNSVIMATPFSQGHLSTVPQLEKSGSLFCWQGQCGLSDSELPSEWQDFEAKERMWFKTASGMLLGNSNEVRQALAAMKVFRTNAFNSTTFTNVVSGARITLWIWGEEFVAKSHDREMGLDWPINCRSCPPKAFRGYLSREWTSSEAQQIDWSKRSDVIVLKVDGVDFSTCLKSDLSVKGIMRVTCTLPQGGKRVDITSTWPEFEERVAGFVDWTNFMGYFPPEDIIPRASTYRFRSRRFSAVVRAEVSDY